MRCTPHADLAPVPGRVELDSLGYIVRAYDRAIAACDAQDAAAARQALGVLRAGLELDSPVSHGFDALYAWCLTSVLEADFDGPARCLRTLRDAWCRAADPATIFPPSRLPMS